MKKIDVYFERFYQRNHTRCYYKFECDDKRAKENDVPVDAHFELWEIEKMGVLIDKCEELGLNYDLIFEVFDEDSNSIFERIWIAETNSNNEIN